MTVDEFNVEFDIYFNNISSNQAPGLNTYEKSVFLTKAQGEVLKNHFNPKGNKYIEGFDDSEKRQVDFSTIIVTKSLSSGTLAEGEPQIDERSKLFVVPTDVLFFLNEKIINQTTGASYNVKPLSYQEYERLMNKPYTLPLKRQAWRLLHSTAAGAMLFEVVANTASSDELTYILRYVRKPKPIIIESLTGDYEGLTIEGVSTKTECELNPALHNEILQRAVELAKIAFEAGANNIIEAGQRSE